MDAHDALGKVCGLLTETDEAATKLLRDMLTKYCPVHGQRGTKLNVNFEEIMCDVIRSTADGELRKLVAGICSQAGMTSAEIIRRVTQKNHEEESMEAEGDTKRYEIDYRGIAIGVTLLATHLRGELPEERERASRVQQSVLNEAVQWLADNNDTKVGDTRNLKLGGGHMVANSAIGSKVLGVDSFYWAQPTNKVRVKCYPRKSRPR